MIFARRPPVMSAGVLSIVMYGPEKALKNVFNYFLVTFLFE